MVKFRKYAAGFEEFPHFPRNPLLTMESIPPLECIQMYSFPVYRIEYHPLALILLFDPVRRRKGKIAGTKNNP